MGKSFPESGMALALFCLAAPAYQVTLAEPSRIFPSMRCRPPLIMASDGVAISAADATCLFGRMAEAKVYLDSEVGVCCHSACSDCEWRLPDGGYRFDILKSMKSKWVPCYVERDFADERGMHTASWATALFPRGEPIDRAEFDTAFSAIAFEMPMGPRGSLKSEQAKPSAEALDVLWKFLAADATSLSVETIRARLQDMSTDAERDGAIGEGPDFVVWKDFAKALGAPPFERW